jgi:hypothetical protein
MKHHRLGKEENIELKYRISEIQNKPEARLWLAHLLRPIHGERVQVKILSADELEKESNNNSELREREQRLKQLGKEFSAVRLYDNNYWKVELVELAEPNYIKDKKILHGIIVTKKEDADQARKFFKLEERYQREKELYQDTYHILWRSLIKGGVDKLTINESRMERVLTDRIASDLTSLNFLGFKKETIGFFASGLAKTSQAMSVAKWLTNNSFIILTDLLNRWDSHLLGDVDTPPASNIRTAFSYSLIYETKIVRKWEEEFERAYYELEDRSAELNIVELPKHTYEQKKEIVQKIIKRLFKKYRKETKERSSDYLSKFANKVSKVLAKESEENKFLEVIDRGLEDLIIETWEERGTRKLRTEINEKFSPENFNETYKQIIEKERESLQKEETYFQEQVKRLEDKLKNSGEKDEKERYENKLKEVKIELRERQERTNRLNEIQEQQLVAQVESKNK